MLPTFNYYWFTRHIEAMHLPHSAVPFTLKKVVPYSITSVGQEADPGFFVISPQVTLVVNPVVGCRYFPPIPRLLSQPKRSPASHYAMVSSQDLKTRTRDLLIASPMPYQ